MRLKKNIIIGLLGMILLLASCGQQNKAQGLVKDFLKENLNSADCSFERFGKLAQTAMIDAQRVEQLRKEMKNIPSMKQDIKYEDGVCPDTLLYIRATYKLTDHSGKEQEYTQTFYMDKELTRIIAFKQN